MIEYVKTVGKEYEGKIIKSDTKYDDVKLNLDIIQNCFCVHFSELFEHMQLLDRSKN